MRSLHIDIETYSTVDLKKAGAYRYAEDDSTEIILFAYAYDDEPVVCVDLLTTNLIYKGDIPEQVMLDLVRPDVVKKAFNANFEIICLKNYFKLDIKAEQWRDTQALVALCGLPLNLGDAAAVLNIDQQKGKDGNALIKYFCVPIKKPIAKNNFRERNLPTDDPIKWEAFKDYNKKDVDAERAISRALSFCNVGEFEHAVWTLDQKINQNGVAVDVPFVKRAIELVNDYEAKLLIEAKELTGLDNPKSVAQLKKWLFEEGHGEFESLNKTEMPAILALMDNDPVAKRVLQIREEGSKTSTKKYPAMLNALCRDGRLRGLHQYGGANRTMRACLAEDSLVLIKNEQGIYEKKIQEVLLTDLVFDGDEWVTHEGVVFSGEKDVISWDNVCATERHIVYLNSTASVPLKRAQEQNLKLWRGNIQFTNLPALQEDII